MKKWVISLVVIVVAAVVAVMSYAPLKNEIAQHFFCYEGLCTAQ
ncbi:hypothetical protein [Megamonas sp.]